MSPCRRRPRRLRNGPARNAVARSGFPPGVFPRIFAPTACRRLHLSAGSLARKDTPAREYLAKQPEKAAAEIAESAAGVLLTTAQTVAGYRIVETLEIVTAECVQGSSSWQKLTASLTDFFGGRSGSMQKMLRDLRRPACPNYAKKPHRPEAMQ